MYSYTLCCYTFLPVDTLDSVGLRDDPSGNGATVTTGPSDEQDAYILSRTLTGDANSDDWVTVFSHFPREFSLGLYYKKETVATTNLFRLFDGGVTLLSVDVQRTDIDQADLVIVFPGGVSVREPVAVSDDGFNSIILKLEGEFLSVYINCSLDSFLKLPSTPDNITATPTTDFSLFAAGYIVSTGERGGNQCAFIVSCDAYFSFLSKIFVLL